jgi:hypothetical protein
VRREYDRFELPNVDHLFSHSSDERESSDEKEIKELKQQKRLLRNRKAGSVPSTKLLYTSQGFDTNYR